MQTCIFKTKNYKKTKLRLFINQNLLEPLISLFVDEDLIKLNQKDEMIEQ